MLRFAVATWPGLCTILVQCINKELEHSSGKKKGPDANVSRTFKRFVQSADDEKRGGVAAHRNTNSPNSSLLPYQSLPLLGDILLC